MTALEYNEKMKKLDCYKLFKIYKDLGIAFYILRDFKNSEKYF